MKKIITVMAVVLMMIGFAGCQKKQITASINYSDPDGSNGGMNAELPENSTLKDMFDELGKGTDFVYELDNEGYVLSINGKGNDEFGYWEILLNNDVLNDTIGNIKLENGDVCNITYIPNTANPIVGGWEIAEIGRTEFEGDEEENFKKATEKLLGETYEPVCVLATQVVNGTNYAYLARGTTVTATPVSAFFIVKVYESLDGEVELKSIAEINLLDIQTRADTDEEILGGWEVRGSGKPGSLGSEEAQSSFEKALESLLGVRYNPIQLLGSQVVNGTNYIALARGTVVSVEDKPELYVMSWYADLEGNSSFTDIKKFDLNYYVTD